MSKHGEKIKDAHLLLHNAINQDLMNFAKLIQLNHAHKIMKGSLYVPLIFSQIGALISRLDHNMNAEMLLINLILQIEEFSIILDIIVCVLMDHYQKTHQCSQLHVINSAVTKMAILQLLLIKNNILVHRIHHLVQMVIMVQYIVQLIRNGFVIIKMNALIIAIKMVFVLEENVYVH